MSRTFYQIMISMLMSFSAGLQRWDGRHDVKFSPTVWNWSTSSTDQTVSRLQIPRVLATVVHPFTASQRSDGNVGLGVPGYVTAHATDVSSGSLTSVYGFRFRKPWTGVRSNQRLVCTIMPSRRYSDSLRLQTFFDILRHRGPQVETVRMFCVICWQAVLS